MYKKVKYLKYFCTVITVSRSYVCVIRFPEDGSMTETCRNLL